ncbi:hypothetical protein [Streptomyces sp. NPDC055709]
MQGFQGVQGSQGAASGAGSITTSLEVAGPQAADSTFSVNCPVDTFAMGGSAVQHTGSPAAADNVTGPVLSSPVGPVGGPSSGWQFVNADALEAGEFVTVYAVCAP